MFYPQDQQFSARRQPRNPLLEQQLMYSPSRRSHPEDRDFPTDREEFTKQFYSKYTIKSTVVSSAIVIAFAAVLLATFCAIGGTYVLSFNYLKAVFVFSSCLLFAGSMYGKLIKTPPLSTKIDDDNDKKSKPKNDYLNEEAQMKERAEENDGKPKHDPVKDFIFNGKNSSSSMLMNKRKKNTRLMLIIRSVQRHFRILKENSSFIAATTLCGLGITIAYFALMCRVSNPTLKVSESINGEGPWSIFIAETSYDGKKVTRFLSSDSYAVIISGIMLGFLTSIRKIYSGDYYLTYPKTFVYKI